MPLDDRELADQYVGWLVGEMAQRGISEAVLARRTGLNPASVWKIMHRQVVPKRKTLQRLARALGLQLPAPRLVSTETLLDRHEAGPHRPVEQRSGADRRQMREAPKESDVEAMKQQARLVQEAVARVVEQHEIAGLDLRKVLGRMANGLDQLGHHEAASELYALVWKLSRLENDPPKEETP